MEKKKINIPKKNAGRKLAERLEKLGKQKPPKSLVEMINQDDRKKIAAPELSSQDLDNQ